MKYIKLLFLTRQNFLKNAQTGGYQVSKSLFQCCEKNSNIEIFLCILDADYDADDGDGLNEYTVHNVKVISINNNPIKTNISYLLLKSGYSSKENCKIKSFIKSSDADVIFFDGTWFGRNIKYICEGMKKIVFCHNIEKEFARNRIKRTKRITAIPRFFSDWYNEQCVIRRADKVICLNERDNILLKKNYGRHADMLLSIMLEDTYDCKAVMQERSNKILFVGSLFFANIEGIRWFCKNVMPFVECELYIVGKGMELLREELERERIKVIGTVDSLAEYYNEADLVVLPIFSGGGMKVKTAEAMMYGKIILASDEALEGYQIDETEDIIRCNTAGEFIDKINFIINDERKSRYSEKNRILFLQHYSISSAYKKLNKLIGELMNEKDRSSI